MSPIQMMPPQVLHQPNNFIWDEKECYGRLSSAFIDPLLNGLHMKTEMLWFLKKFSLFLLSGQIKPGFLTPQHKAFPIHKQKHIKIPSLHITVYDINLKYKLIIASASWVHFEVFAGSKQALHFASFRRTSNSHIHMQTHMEWPEGELSLHLNILKQMCLIIR